MDNRKAYIKPKIVDYNIETNFELEQCFCSCSTCKEDCPNYGKDFDKLPETHVILIFENGMKLKFITNNKKWIM